jgi:uncharacterized protein (TIGR02246 family)
MIKNGNFSVFSDSINHMLSELPTDPPAISDEEGIQGVLQGFTGGWNMHNAKIFSKVFTQDADFTNVLGMYRHGRTAIEEIHAPGFEGIWASSTLSITKSKIRFIKPDVAAVDAVWDLIGLKKQDGSDSPDRNGLLNFIMTKNNDGWLISVMHNMDLPGSTPQACVAS